MHLLISLGLTLLFAPVSTSLTVEFKAKYFTDTTLVCNEGALGLPYTTFKKFWALPNGTVLQWSQPADRKYTVGQGPAFNLSIARIDDSDFGWYYCIILWDDYIYLTHSIKVGLNVNGADYEDMYEVYESNAIIGGIAGAATAAVVALCCLVYWCRYSEVNTVNKDKQDSEKSDHVAEPSSVDTNTESKDSKLDDEREAIYVLDKAVKDFDEGVDNDGVSSHGAVGVGFELRRLSSFRGDDYDDALPPPPPPPPPPVTSLEDEHQFDAAMDTYDKLPQSNRSSQSHVARVIAELHGEIYARPRDSVEIMNLASEKEIHSEENDECEEQGIGVLHSTEFQEEIADERC